MIIAGDDETRDAISNGPCETDQALPRKRRKVRNSPPQSLQSQQRPTIGDMIERLAQEQQARERVNGSLNGGNKVRLKLPKPNLPLKEEPLEPNDASDVQAKSGPDNATEEDICAVCVRNIPLGDSGTSPIYWIACDYCPKWFHQTCVVMPPGFNKKRDKFKCDSCKKKTH